MNRPGCWLAKQSNDTSVALSGLLLDADSLKQATLQNRAAIFVLLFLLGFFYYYSYWLMDVRILKVCVVGVYQITVNQFTRVFQS